jgi:hypothetical protein
MAIRPGLLLLAGAGGVLLWSGIQGKSVTSVFRQLIGGDNPKAAANANTIVQTSDTGLPQTPNTIAQELTGTNAVPASPNASGNSAANQAAARLLAIAMGHADWTVGQQWQDWVLLWNQESGWNQYAANPTSDARGIAQNINGYGPDYQQGNAQSQIVWGINYIAGRYGSPSAAWAHEVSNNWY